MPLALSVKIGEVVKIGDTEFTMDRVMENGDFVMIAKGEAFHIVEERYTEVMPEVLVSVGFHEGDTRAKLTIDAPRSIPITRVKHET